MKKLPGILGLLLILLFLGQLLSSCTPNQEEISMTSLVEKMTDRSWITQFPEPLPLVKQFSSYDQNSIAPDQDGWFANHDASWFIRQEENQGRREFVMLDAEGPGSVVRFWMTFGNKDAYTGTIRFYFDGAEVPEIEGAVLDVFSGGMLVGEPLSSSVSPETDYFKRGHNLYLPIPYAEDLKITYECPALDPERHSPSVYYNINYSTYPSGTDVKTFTMAELAEAEDVIAEVQDELVNKSSRKKAMTDFNLHELNGNLVPGASMQKVIDTQNAITRLVIKLQAKDLPQALRSTVISISFDDNETVWAPMGDFFGTGYQIRPYETWYTSVTEGGVMISNWVMPFKKTAAVTFTNYGDQEVEIVIGNIATDKYKWTKQSMHFGAKWHEFHAVESGGSSGVNGDDGHFDVNYVELSGEGVYVGDVLTIFNTAHAWWGEGDEKIYIDGEDIPSHIGTGTEDYFGYAWCRPEKFSHFLIAQPDGAGNFHPGMSVNMRHRIIDNLPFTSSIKFDMELWHWAKTIMNYAPMSYWYLKPGGEVNIKADPEAVKKKVALYRADLIKPQPVKDGILEGENLRIVNVSTGNYMNQSVKEWNWHNGSQLWWIADAPKANLTSDFIMEEGGQYQVTLTFTKAIDYARFRIGLNGKFHPVTLDGYHDQSGQDVITKDVKMGIFTLPSGINTLEVEVVGKNPKAVDRYMVGIDVLKLVKIE